eukprot:TRINITY_DN4254_c0_g1_i7.p1 TRINITY_DN4254_c0_g1~~TRINITY_DN4254_c0_g1_i7.p1  ORF type:complete len:281 (+),score=48.21 TRINITY_DN4254_c0_g1_i7:127-843(+)
MSSVSTLVGETNNLVKKNIMQLIVSISNQGYLPLEGGQTLVHFIVKQCALNVGEEKDAPVKKGGGEGDDETSPKQIRDAATHILYVMATKVTSAETVLWPFLLELINNPKYSNAIVVLAKSIAHVGNLKREKQSEDYNINFETLVNIPSPQKIMARLMILAALPYREKGIGQAICSLMGALGPIIHPGLGKYWDDSVPSLLSHLEAHTKDTLNLTKWQEIGRAVQQECRDRSRMPSSA